MNLELTNPVVLISATVIVLLILVGIALYIRRRRIASAGLRTRFGPEYDRAVVTHGSIGKAEAKLANRETRVEGLNIREISPPERSRFLADWEGVQSRFLDSPTGSVMEADQLISTLLTARGYPQVDFDRRTADLSVNHPRLVEHYRSAHAVAVRLGDNPASTEQLRAAMIQYRSLFDELVEEHLPVEIREVA